MLLFRGQWLLILAFVLLFGGTANAEDSPAYSLRYLAIEAETILEAIPADSSQNATESTFNVVRVLKGTNIKPKDSIRVAGLSLYRSDHWWGFSRGKEQPKPYEVEKVLLFLTLRQDGTPVGEGHFYPLASGIRYLTKDEQVLRPQQMMNPGDYHLFPVQNTSWERMLEIVRSTTAEAARVEALKAIENPSRRNDALLEWIEKHRQEFDRLLPFREVQYTEPIVIGIRDNKPIIMGAEMKEPDAKVTARPKGWGVLEQRTFDWIMDSCIASDCLRALKLYTEIFPGDILQTRFPSFGSPQGRNLLLEVVVDEQQPLTYRRQALYQLSGSFWVYADAARPQLVSLEKTQQVSVINKLLPLLKTKDVLLRSWVVSAVGAASVDDNAGLHRNTGQALLALSRALKVETDKYVRDQLAEAIRLIQERLKAKE